MVMDGHRERQPHFVLVPLMAQGHTIPMVDLALLLAERGVLVSFITTPFNASRIKDTVRRAQDSRLPIRFVELHFPCQEAGLPEGCENIDYLSEPQQPCPSVIISDFFYDRIADDYEPFVFTADGIVVNSFEGLEKSYIEGYQKVMGKKASIDASRCLSWLDTMKPRSVLYVCFGSLARLEPSQAMEIGLGLEASNHPFVWVIKASEESEERVEEWLSGGFQERVSSRALIVKGWAPQAMILSHPAIGGFMTHCGWNSTLEGVTAGVPMITWPHFADQFLNERMVVDVLKVGVSVGVKRPSFLTFDQQSGLPVQRDDVERCVRSLMDEGRNGEERRKRAKELGEKAEAAMKQAGSSYSNITHLIESSGKTLSPQGRGTKSSIMDGHREGMPHFVLVPLMTQGHMITMTDLALLLADRGVLVSFITTPCNAARIKDTIHRARDSGLPIRFVELPFPGAEEGLAEGWENIDDLPRAELYINFYRATYLLRQPLELYLQGQQQPYPSPFTVPGLREKIEVTRAQASEFFPGPIFENIAKDVREAEFAADGIVVNSFQDLEHAYIEGYQEAMGKIVWTTGPLKASIDVDHCLGWLGTMKPRSVLYVESAEKIEPWLAGGFEERVGSRALIIKGWAPQLMILSHPAIGGFLTHCGWNSTLEAISAGIPMITWPHFTDQFLNERMIVEVLKVGVPIGVKEPNFIGMQRSETLVSRNDVERSVRSLMDEGKEGEERRQRAERLGEKANAAMKEGRGSSHSNVTRLIEHFSANATV
ncbi:unnamed protein product [Musa hybrid cultivar]